MWAACLPPQRPTFGSQKEQKKAAEERPQAGATRLCCGSHLQTTMQMRYRAINPAKAYPFGRAIRIVLRFGLIRPRVRTLPRMKERKTLTQRKKLIYIFTIPKLKRELHTHPTTHTHTPQTTQKRKTTDRNQVPDPKIFGWPLKFYSNISLKYFRHMSQTIPLLRPYWANTHPFNKTQPRIKLPPLRPHLIGESLLRVTPPLRAPPPVAS